MFRFDAIFAEPIRFIHGHVIPCQTLPNYDFKYKYRNAIFEYVSHYLIYIIANVCIARQAKYVPWMYFVVFLSFVSICLIVVCDSSLWIRVTRLPMFLCFIATSGNHVTAPALVHCPWRIWVIWPGPKHNKTHTAQTIVGVIYNL